MKNRIIYIDILKLFTIFLVLWGHAVMQFQPDYKSSLVYQTIYAFHMPLFMMLSGYFAPSSMVLDVKVFLLKKIRQLLLPCLSWGIICWLIITSGLINGEFNLQIKKLFTGGWLGLIDNFWFLKSCFICYTLSWLCFRFRRYKFFAFGVAWLFCLMTSLFQLKIMFPCFLLGLFLRNNRQFEDLLSRKYLYAPIMVFLVLLVSKIIGIEEFYITKLILGISGSVSCFMLFKKYISRLSLRPFINKVANIGGATLGIYILQAILLEILMPQYVSFRELPMPVIVLLMPIISVFILWICWIIIELINKSSILACLMFGREYYGEKSC